MHLFHICYNDHQSALESSPPTIKESRPLRIQLMGVGTLFQNFIFTESIIKGGLVVALQLLVALSFSDGPFKLYVYY